MPFQDLRPVDRPRADVAGRNLPPIAIRTLDLAPQTTLSPLIIDHPFQRQLRLLAAGPAPACAVAASLPCLWGVDPRQANPLALPVERVTVDDTHRLTGEPRGGRRYDQGERQGYP